MACQLLLTVMVTMQLLRATLVLSIAPEDTKVTHRGNFLDRGVDPLADVASMNNDALKIKKKIDGIDIQCKMAQMKDKETIQGLEHDLRLVAGQVAGNVGQLGSVQNSADQAAAEIVKMKGQLVQTASLCETQQKSLNASVGMMMNDQDKAKSLREMSSKCGSAALTAVSTSSSTVDSALLLQGCSEEVSATMLAAGRELQTEAHKFMTPFAKQAFAAAVRYASTTATPAALIESWPSKSKPPSKSKAKSANACKVDSLNCGKLKGEIEALANRLEEQKNTAVTNQRRQVEECEHKEKQLNDNLKATQAQHGRSNTELVRLTGVKAGLAAQRASVVTRLERSQRDAKKFASSCKSGKSEYEGELEDLFKKRKKAVGKKKVVQDCKVTDWKFSKCSKPCKKSEKDKPGMRDASREVIQVAAPDGVPCPPLTAMMPCNDQPCPTDCEVGEWDKWSLCSKACGGGNMKRTRKVRTQTKDGGKACPMTEERKNCNVGRCSETCKLEPWTPWSACTRRCRYSKTSASGRQRQIREVIGNPVKTGGGSPCPPEDDKTRFMSRTCNKEICPKGITCDASQDILFILDASGDAGADFATQLELVAAVVKRSSRKVHIGAVSYGKDVKILSRITSSRKTLASISGYKPAAGGSRDCANAEVVGRTLFADPGVGGGRPKIAVLLLGGVPSSFAEAKKAAEELRLANVRVVVGLVDDGSQLARDQACELASTPCEANVEAVSSWQQMADEPGRFLAGICRNLVYPLPPPSPMAEMVKPKKKKSRKKKSWGSYKKKKSKKKEMPAWLKRQLGLK